jgi:hypothetical protein
MEIGKNDPLPTQYDDYPYHYHRTNVCTVLRVCNDTYFLFGEDEKQFFRECNRAKQQGDTLSSVIYEYCRI